MLSVSQHKMYKSAHATELWTSIWSTTATQSDALTNSSDQIPPACSRVRLKKPTTGSLATTFASAAKAKCCARPGTVSYTHLTLPTTPYV